MTQSIDSYMSAVEKELDYQLYLTPVNYNEENEKFLDAYRRGCIYDPVYTYRKFDSSRARELFALLEKEPVEKTAVGQIYSRAIAALEKRIRMYETIGTDDFTGCCFDVYGRPDEKLLAEAVKVLDRQQDQSDDSLIFTAYDLEKVIRRRLDSYGFSWEILVTPDMAPRVSVEPDRKTIYINAGKSFSAADMVRLQRHEIDTHVLRTENGSLRPSVLFSIGSDQSLMHEEGLALYNEKKYGVSDDFALNLYAARFLVCLNADRSFHELYDDLIRRGCPESTAIYVVPRIKRGLCDTSLPGGYIKDYVYFQGMHEVSAAVAADPPLYTKMYYGSVSLSDVRILEAEIDAAIKTGSMLLPLEDITPVG